MSTSRASAKMADDMEYVEIELPSSVVGESTSGELYVTRHCCTSCSAEIETIGAGHPTFKCSRCNMPMIPHCTKIIYGED